MNAQDTDNKPENQRITARAHLVLAGILEHPGSWEQVAPILGPVLGLDKRNPLRGDSWTRTAWAALVEIACSGNAPDVLQLREQMSSLARKERKGLLPAWTADDRERANGLVREHGLGMKSYQVVEAAQRLADYVTMLGLADVMHATAAYLQAGALLTAEESIARLEQHAREHCQPRKKIKRGNLGDVVAEMFADTAANTSWEMDNAGERFRSLFANRPSTYVIFTEDVNRPAGCDPDTVGEAVPGWLLYPSKEGRSKERKGGQATYAVSADRCGSPEELLAWLTHLSGKSWFTLQHAKQFMHSVRCHYDWPYRGV